MRLPENRFLAWCWVFGPPLVATAIPLLMLRWAIFFQIVGVVSIWFSLQVVWGLYCRVLSRDIEDKPELFL